MIGQVAIVASVNNSWDALWLDWLLKATLLLALAWLSHAVLCRANPTWRVLTWRLTMLGLFVVPLLAIVAPRIEVRVPALAPLEAVSRMAGAAPDSAYGTDPWSYSAGPYAARRSPAPQLASVGNASANASGADGGPSTQSPPDAENSTASESRPRSASLMSVANWPVRRVVFTVWFAGVGVCLLRLVPAVRRARRVIDAAGPPSERLITIYQDVAANFGLRHVPELWVTKDLSMPVLMGVFQPVLLLPEYFHQQRFNTDLPAVLVHELAHARARDIVWDYVIYGMRCVLWFHPFAWRVSAAHEKACEDVCDAVSARFVGNVNSYATTLARVALIVNARLAAMSLPTIGGVAMAKSSEVSRRLTRLKSGRVLPAPARWQMRCVTLMAVMLAAVVAGLNFGYARAVVSKFVLPRTQAPLEWIGDLTPISPLDWNYDRAAHLLERAGFGGTPAEIAELAAMSPVEAVSALLDYESIDNGHLPPFDESQIYEPGVVPYSAANVVLAAINEGRARGEAIGVQARPGEPMPLQPIVDEGYFHLYGSRLESRRVALWWADRMLATHRPLEEKLALFWHDHFAINYDRVGDYRKLLLYLQTLHRHATGNFRDFVLAIAQEPAMLVCLENGDNVRGHANERFSRELLESFTMGKEGGFTKLDLRDVARAFTGWTQDDLSFVVYSDLHDDLPKSLFGTSGNLDGVDVVDLIVRQPATARLITHKLYNYFVSEDLSPAVAEELAARFVVGRFELKPLLRTMFLSKDFYSRAAVGTQVKSPAQLVISTFKKLGLNQVPGVPDFRTTMVALGQELLAPQKFAGARGGREWIQSDALTERNKYIEDLLYGEPIDRAGGLRPSASGELDRPRTRPMRGPSQTDETQFEAREGAGETAFPMMFAGPRGIGPVDRPPRTDEYNLSLAVQRGIAKAHRRVKSTPQAKAELNLCAMAEAAGARTPAEVVDYLTLRFLRLPLANATRESLIKLVRNNAGEQLDYRSERVEALLRDLLHLLLSTPEYQVS